MNTFVYGERPITQLCMSLMTEDDLRGIIKSVELMNPSGGKCKVQFNPRERFHHVWIEAPLGKKYGRVDLMIRHPDFRMMIEVKPAPFEKVKSELQKQIPNYLDSIIDSPEHSSKNKIVQRATAPGDKHNLLICMTDDSEFPSGLQEMYQGIHARLCNISKAYRDEKDKKDIQFGWVPYKPFKDLLEKNGYRLFNEIPDIVAERCSNKLEGEKFMI